MVRPVAFPCCVYAVVTPQEKEGVETKPWSEASGAMLGGWNGRRRTSDGFCSWLCFQAGCPILQQLGTREGSGVQSGQNQSLGARSSLNLRARPDSLCVCVWGGGWSAASVTCIHGEDSVCGPGGRRENSHQEGGVRFWSTCFLPQ